MAEPIVALREAIVDQTGKIRSRAWSNLFQWLKARLVGEPGSCALRWGTGTPEGVISSPIGGVYLRTDGGAGTTLYVKESGSSNTGWKAK